MNRNIASSLKILCLLFAFFNCISACKKKTEEVPAAPVVTPQFSANANPAWKAGAKLFLAGPTGSFDGVSVKDPSIVYSGSKYHLFYTGRDANDWRMGYASAATLDELKSAQRTYMNSLKGGSYFCAPEVFWFESKSTWYLIYQSGLGATYSTNADVSNPNGWTPGVAMGFSDGIDFWCISDGSFVYCFYSAQDGSKTIKMRTTSVAAFPTGWSNYTVVADNTFEAPHVYKNKADGKYYMMVEDIGRYFELWGATYLGGPWTKIAEKWADKTNLTETADHWTDQVSHGEIIRTGTNERLEINDINRCDVLIQGVVNGTYSSYGNIPYVLGLIKNY